MAWRFALLIAPPVLILCISHHRIALVLALLETALLEVLLGQLLLESFILLLDSLLPSLNHMPELGSLLPSLFCLILLLLRLPHLPLFGELLMSILNYLVHVLCSLSYHLHEVSPFQLVLSARLLLHSVSLNLPLLNLDLLQLVRDVLLLFLVLTEESRLFYLQLALFSDLTDAHLLFLLPPLHLFELLVLFSQLDHAFLPLAVHPRLLLFKLLLHGHLGLMLPLLLLDERRLPFLLSLDLCDLLLDVFLLFLALEVLHLHLKLVSDELIGFPGVPASLLPVVHADFLTLDHLLVQQVHLLPCYAVVVLLLLLL